MAMRAYAQLDTLGNGFTGGGTGPIETTHNDYRIWLAQLLAKLTRSVGVGKDL